MAKRRHLLCLLMLVCMPAAAQTACPQGVAAGSAQCGPSMPEIAQDVEPSAPTIRYVPIGEWISRWGSIAMDPGGKRIGAVAGLDSEQHAETEAMKRCAKEGNVGCKIMTTYSNGCVALAWPAGTGMAVVKVADEAETAQANAMQACSVKNKGACEILYQECSAAVFHRF